MNIKTFFENAKSSDTVPELTISYRKSKIKRSPLLTTESKVEFLREVFDPGTFDIREEFILVPMDIHCNPIGWYSLAKGSSTSVMVDNKIIFLVLLALQADSFFTAHNHPHRNSLPSQSDIESCHSTNLISNIAEIEYLDDIVISRLESEPEEEDQGYFSLADNGLFFG